MSFAIIASIGVAVTVGGIVASSESAKKANRLQKKIAEEQFKREDERLAAQEKELEDIQATAKRAAIRAKRGAARRSGGSSTIIAGRTQSDFQRLGEVRKKRLGAGA